MKTPGQSIELVVMAESLIRQFKLPKLEMILKWHGNTWNMIDHDGAIWPISMHILFSLHGLKIFLSLEVVDSSTPSGHPKDM